MGILMRECEFTEMQVMRFELVCGGIPVVVSNEASTGFRQPLCNGTLAHLRKP
jgi:hypothetical protein